MENLAPAGSPEALERAVAAGADAVYLGYAAFSARAGAGNFDDAQLREAVHFAHLHGVRIHLALNTLVKDSELDGVLQVLRLACEVGVDAVLVQDLGILRLAGLCAPGLCLHASTQMAIHNAAGVAWCGSQGIRRVVLARECPLPEIRLAADTGVEVEVFSHGAQCVSVSGECLFSSMLGDRSGNRGRCAQPCRLRYSWQGREGAWLSPRDICLRNDLPALYDAGVASIKIEGRLKRPEYVAVVTASYRKGIDSAAAGSFQPADEAEWNGLKQMFHRGGFMRGYTFGCEDAGVIAPERVNHGGMPLGIVTSVRGRLASARLSAGLHDGDQLRLEGAGGDMELNYAGPDTAAGGTAVLRLREGMHVHPGDALVRLADAEQLRQAMALPMPRIPVWAQLRAVPGEPLKLSLRDDSGCQVHCEGQAVQAAQTRAMSEEALRRSLGKMGGSAFRLAGCEIDCRDAFVPVSALNSLRREAVLCLEEARLKAADRSCAFTPCDTQVELPKAELPALFVFRHAEQLRCAPEGARLCWHPEDWRQPALEQELARLPQGVWLALPMACEQDTLMSLRRFVREHRRQIDGVLLGSVGQLGLDWPVPFGAGPGIPVMNRQAAALLLQCGCAFITASPELSAQELQQLMAGHPPIAVPAWGRQQLMLLHHCPARTAQGLHSGHRDCRLCDTGSPGALAGTCLTDRTQAAFPLLRERLPEGCLVRLMNSLPTDLRRQVSEAGWTPLLEMTVESELPPPDEVRSTSAHWRRPVL